MPGLPPQMTGQPNYGSMPIAQPSGAPGNSANAVAQIREALQILQHSLPNIPVGSDLYEAVLKSITNLSKHAPAAQAAPGVQKTQALAQAQQAQQQQPMQSLMRAMSANGGGQGESPQPPM